MKKLMIAATAALCATVGFSSIESANIVGYQTIDAIAGGQFKALAVQFDAVAGDAIAVKDLVVVESPAGNATISSMADQIWRWDSAKADWVKYFFRSSRGVVTGWCKAGETTVTDDTVPAGETVFFNRGGSKASSITVSGAVKPFEASLNYSVTGGQFTFMAYPWPVALPIAGFEKYQGKPAGNASISSMADQIWLWNITKADWDKYFFRSSRGVVTGWCKAGATTVTEDAIPAGEGFFFQKGGSAADTVTFTYGE